MTRKILNYLCLMVLLNTFSLSAFAQDININYGEGAGNVGDTVDVDITIDGFVDIRNFNFTTHWDETKLEFVKIKNQTTLLPISQLFFGTTNPRRVATVFSTAGATDVYNLSSSDVLVTLQYKILSTATECIRVDTFSDIPARTSFFGLRSGNEVSLSKGSTPSDIAANGASNCGTSSTDDFTITALDQLGQMGTEVCVTLEGTNMTNIAAAQNLGLRFDPNELEFKSASMILPQSELSVLDVNAATGEIELTYNTFTVNGVTGNDIPMISICFEVLGDCDNTSLIDLFPAANFLAINYDGELVTTNLIDGEFTVNCGPLCSFDVVETDISCNGEMDGSIDLNLNGCTNITSIVWQLCDGTVLSNTNEVIDNLSAGCYGVTVNYDSGTKLIRQDSIIIQEPSAVIITNQVLTNVTLGNDGAIDLTIAGGNGGNDYLWSNSDNTLDIDGLAAGDYSLTVTDVNNCVYEFGPFEIEGALSVVGVVANEICFGDLLGAVDITVDGGSGDYSYAWTCPGTVTNGDISDLPAGQCIVTVIDQVSSLSVSDTFDISGPTEALSLDNQIVVDDINNLGEGSISLSINGGSSPYSFDWGLSAMTNPIVGLFNGNYSCTVTDNNDCTIVVGPFAVSGGFEVNGIVSGIGCFGESNGGVDLNISGGSGNYNVAWTCTNPVQEGTIDVSGNISGLVAGTCIATVTDITNNIIATESFEIPGSTSSLQVNAISMANDCSNGADGSARVEITGGLEPYQYNWNTSPIQTTIEAVNLSTGLVSVLVTDSLGCQVMDQVNVRDCNAAGDDCFEGRKVITPNADGLNDQFIISCSEAVNNKLRIFTRWGQEVIEYNNYNGTWEGYDESGNLVDEDTYMWVLEVFPSPGEVTLYKGAVSVLYELR